MRHENWCELKQGGICCDCGAEKKQQDYKENKSYPRAVHKNWCELNQGGLHCDCGLEKPKH